MFPSDYVTFTDCPNSTEKSTIKFEMNKAMIGKWALNIKEISFFG